MGRTSDTASIKSTRSDTRSITSARSSGSNKVKTVSASHAADAASIMSNRSNRSTHYAPPHPPGVNIPMGSIGFMNTLTGKYEVYHSVGVQARAASPQADTVSNPEERGFKTRGLSLCFTVVAVGSEGLLMSHVSAYLGDDRLGEEAKVELDAMKKMFAAVWKQHRKELNDINVVLIPGAYTKEENMWNLFSKIFPNLAGYKDSIKRNHAIFWCEKSPTTGATPDHGTAMVLTHRAKSIWVEGKQRM